jgi:dihydrofolate reductase
MILGAIFATDSAGGMGYQTHMPWPRIGTDLKYFKKHTLYTPIIMGTRTWCSEDMHNPLPNRQSIVWTRQKSLPNITPEVMLVSGTPDQCWNQIQSRFQQDRAWVIGGAETLRAWMPFCSEVRWSHILGKWPSDVAYHSDQWQKDFDCIEIESTSEQNIQLEFSYWKRKKWNNNI